MQHILHPSQYRPMHTLQDQRNLLIYRRLQEQRSFFPEHIILHTSSYTEAHHFHTSITPHKKNVLLNMCGDQTTSTPNPALHEQIDFIFFL